MRGAVDCDLLLYANDSTLLVSGKSITDIEHKLEIELNSICHWLIENMLSIQLGKTESIVFGYRTKPIGAKKWQRI